MVFSVINSPFLRSALYRSFSACLIQALLIFSLTAQQKPVRQSALDAFSKGDYETAYADFSKLLITYPKDPLYKYYSGVCLVNLERDAAKAVELLHEAQQGSVVVRTVPADVLFWLGRAQQMSGLFSEATGSFNSYTELYGKRAARELDIPLYIQQCSEGRGRLDDDPVKAVPAPGRTDESIVPEASDEDSIAAGIDLLLEEAMGYQQKADSLYSIAEELKGRLNDADSNTRSGLNERITQAEALAATYQKSADRIYAEAQSAMNSTSFTSLKRPARDEDTETVDLPVQEKAARPDTVIAERKVQDARAIEKMQPEERVLRDSVQVISPEPVTQVEEPKKEAVVTVQQQKPVLSVFEVGAAGSKVKIPVNEEAPDGLIYRIQVAVFRNPVDLSYFKGLSPVYGFRQANSDNTVYYAGLFRRIADARQPLASVRNKGFRDAFIVAMSDGKRISLERAAVLEKEWGTKSLVKIVPVDMTSPADTLPPELCFRVEVMRSPKPVKDEVLESMQRVSGTRGFDTEETEDGYIYLIGRFITYESALSYSDLLVRNGYRDAKVVARLGKKEVPVDAARELFEKVR